MKKLFVLLIVAIGFAFAVEASESPPSTDLAEKFVCTQDAPILLVKSQAENIPLVINIRSPMADLATVKNLFDESNDVSSVATLAEIQKNGYAGESTLKPPLLLALSNAINTGYTGDVDFYQLE